MVNIDYNSMLQVSKAFLVKKIFRDSEALKNSEPRPNDLWQKSLQSLLIKIWKNEQYQNQ